MNDNIYLAMSSMVSECLPILTLAQITQDNITELAWCRVITEVRAGMFCHSLGWSSDGGTLSAKGGMSVWEGHWAHTYNMGTWESLGTCVFHRVDRETVIERISRRGGQSLLY